MMNPRKIIAIQIIQLLFLAATLLVTFSCSNAVRVTSTPNNVKINQLGFLINEQKIAIVDTSASIFKIIKLSGQIVFEDSLSSPKYWTYSGETVKVAEFSKLTQPGVYQLITNNNLASYAFKIGNNNFDSLSNALLKAFYFNRASITLDEKYAGDWARTIGHPDSIVYIHQSAATINRPTNTTISSSKGWYDAGDYNKYIVNSSITCYTMLLLIDQYKIEAEKLAPNIPEENNEVPDLLDEILWNIDWMLTMQDDDGGVYHKLTNEKFDDFSMPDKCNQKRYVVQKSTAATLDFASTMAIASRVISKYETKLPNYSKKLLAASIKAWNWAQENPSTYYKQPNEFNTGEYNDTSLIDEWAWAGTELFIATKNSIYLMPDSLFQNKITTPSWDVVHPLAYLSLLTSNTTTLNQNFKQIIEENFFQYINKLCTKSETSAYRVSIDFFKWGSNSDVANQGVLKIIAFKLTGDIRYKNSAFSDLDYLLGRNPTRICFVTGFGEKSPLNIHHRPSGADSIIAPVPGFLVGGPNLIVPNDCGEKYSNDKFPALHYIDMQCSYSTNEVAINWNAPMLFLTCALKSSEN